MEQITMEQLKECRPYLIKPNLYELQLLFDNIEINESNIEECLRKANALGIENILVSLGKDGAVLSNAQGIFKLVQPRTVLVNKVGAGENFHKDIPVKKHYSGVVQLEMLLQASWKILHYVILKDIFYR